MSNRRLHLHTIRPLALVIALSAALPAMAQVVDFGLPTGATGAAPTGINADGSVVVGRYTQGLNRAFRWTSAGGFLDLGARTDTGAAANAVSASGNVVVGYAGNENGDMRAFRWTANGGLDFLGLLPGGTSMSQANGVSADGSVVVGVASSGSGMRAFRWTADDRIMHDLGALAGGNFSQATGVNAIGNVVVGQSNSTNGSRAFRWKLGEGMIDLGLLPGGHSSNATAVNAAGDVVVGNTTYMPSGMRAFRWSEAAPLVLTDLGHLDGHTGSFAAAVDGSGDIVVGASLSSGGNRAFRWTEATGMQSVEEWLADAGVNVSASFQTQEASAISADGKVIVGVLPGNRPFIARVSEDDGGSNPGGGDPGSGSGGGSGLIDVAEYLGGLSQTASAVALPLRDADPVLHGAHGSPMEWLLAPGKTSVRVAGDIARNDRSGTDSEQALGEFGVAHAFSPTLQGQIALGASRSKQNLYLDGSARLRSTYVVPTLIWQATPGLYASFTGYYADGDMRMNRGYLNAGTPDFSYGETSTSTTALRARLDWRDLWSWNNVSFTPYTSLTLSRTSTDGYTEAGGGFPVQWDKRKDKLDVLRLGLDGTKTLTGDVRLTGRVELAHRIGGDTRSSASGTILGLSSFNVDSSATQRSEWLRLGVGVDLPLGPGRFSTTLNATTQGSAPAYWLAASYRMDF